MSSEPRNPHGYVNTTNMQEVWARIINAQDPQKAGRYQIRIFGDQDNLIEIPDEKLVWASCMRNGFSSHRGMGLTSKYVPGDTVLVKVINGQYIIQGSFMKESEVTGEKADQNPMALDGTDSWKSPPAKNEDSFMGWLNNFPSALKTTQAVLNDQQSRRRTQSKKAQAEQNSKPGKGSNRGRSNSRFASGDHASIAKDLPFDNAQDFFQTIQKVGNRSSVFPSMLNMVNTLRNKSGSANPSAIASIGGGNYTQFLSQLQGFFPELQKLYQQLQDASAEEEQEQSRKEAQLRKALEVKRKEEEGTLTEED